MHLVDVLIATIGSYRLPIITSILVGHVVDSKPSSLFRLIISHLESTDFEALVHSVWNLVPRPRGGKEWLLWWQATIHHIVKFKRGWGCMIAHKRGRELRETRQKLEEPS